MNEMPWWAILLIVVAIFAVLFVWLMLGMGVGESMAVGSPGTELEFAL